eukprot:TRINITY_DN16898_c0_g1_i1.p1 TRINITY_DN16898_c0_g1~~TRINITY_DN16898_c0_g1_i1.p1  ORF type:complete len:458 (+),score=135.14 TRINITY_DN16898_c0_g1_i1:93-1466(+)
MAGTPCATPDCLGTYEEQLAVDGLVCVECGRVLEVADFAHEATSLDVPARARRGAVQTSLLLRSRVGQTQKRVVMTENMMTRRQELQEKVADVIDLMRFTHQSAERARATSIKMLESPPGLKLLRYLRPHTALLFAGYVVLRTSRELCLGIMSSVVAQRLKVTGRALTLFERLFSKDVEDAMDDLTAEDDNELAKIFGDAAAEAPLKHEAVDDIDEDDAEDGALSSADALPRIRAAVGKVVNNPALRYLLGAAHNYSTPVRDIAARLKYEPHSGAAPGDVDEAKLKQIIDAASNLAWAGHVVNGFRLPLHEGRLLELSAVVVMAARHVDPAWTRQVSMFWDMSCVVWERMNMPSTSACKSLVGGYVDMLYCLAKECSGLARFVTSQNFMALNHIGHVMDCLPGMVQRWQRLQTSSLKRALDNAGERPPAKRVKEGTHLRVTWSTHTGHRTKKLERVG